MVASQLGSSKIKNRLMCDSIAISFIVPVYNVEPYLRECIESIRKQQGSWELILIDDGSPDTCPVICDEYAGEDNRIKVIHKQNGGVSSARNAGLDVAQGEWIWFVDADDYIITDALQQLIPKIANQSYDMVRFTMKDLVNGQLKAMRFIPDSKEILIDELLLKYPCYNNVMMLFRRQLIESNSLRFSYGLRLGEDMEFQLKYLLFCRHAVQCSLSLSIYRTRLGSATKSAQSRAYLVNDTAQVMRNLLLFIQERNIAPKAWFRMRVQGMMSNLLYSASLVPNIDRGELQTTVCSIMDAYNVAGVRCFDAAKMRLAYHSVTLYFILNRTYFRFFSV